MKKSKLSMAMLGVSAAFALVSASTQAQNASNQNAATGTPSTTSKQAASMPNSATTGATSRNTGDRSNTGMAGTTQGVAGQGTAGMGTAGTGNAHSGQSMSGASQSGQTASAAGQSSTQGNTASGSGKGSLSKADQKLVRDMAMTNMAEIETARMAQSKSQSEMVKTYAQRMIDDHTKALTEVQQLAQTKGMTLPTELDKMHKAKADKLAKLSGEQFDKAYMAQAGVADHKKAHAKLQMASNKAKDADVKALAGRMHPTVQDHLKMAQEHNTHMKSAATGSSGSGATASGTGMTDKPKDKH
jgi:predicted outer membrane protein